VTDAPPSTSSSAADSPARPPPTTTVRNCRIQPPVLLPSRPTPKRAQERTGVTFPFPPGTAARYRRTPWTDESLLMFPDKRGVAQQYTETLGGRALQARVPVYRGRFGRSEAERLLWRAGFGPKRGEAAQLARLGLRRAVDRLAYPPKEKLTGPKPRDDKGHKLAPQGRVGTRRSLVARPHGSDASSTRGTDGSGLARLVCNLRGRC
jgi:hypothetical protein